MNNHNPLNFFDCTLLNSEIVDGGPLIDNMQYRRLENMRASIFAVSGTRKVACIVSFGCLF